MIYPPQALLIQTKERTDDGIGGFHYVYQDYGIAEGYIDYLSGTDQATKQNALTEESTHVAVIPEYTGLIDADMELMDEQGKIYVITYVDNPVSVSHHLELYLTYKVMSEGDSMSMAFFKRLKAVQASMQSLKDNQLKVGDIP